MARDREARYREMGRVCRSLRLNFVMVAAVRTAIIDLSDAVYYLQVAYISPLSCIANRTRLYDYNDIAMARNSLCSMNAPPLGLQESTFRPGRIMWLL